MPSETAVALQETQGTVAGLSTALVGGGVAFALVSSALGYALFCRRVTVPHLTSVVDEDATESSATRTSKD